MTVIEKEENGLTRTYNDVLCCCTWDKESVIYVAKDRDIDLEDMPESFWKYLSEWMQNGEYFPNTSDEVMDAVNEVLKRKGEW